MKPDRHSLAWPEGKFGVHDEPGEHDPCYLVCPDNLMIPFNAHATDGVDQARAQWFAEVLNAALEPKASPKTVYVAHPFTTYGCAEDNFRKQELLCKKLFAIGYTPVSPILVFGKVIPHDAANYDAAMRACLWLLSACSEVHFFGEWRKSRGCNMEYAEAERLGKKIGFGFYCEICGADITYDLGSRCSVCG